MSKYTPATFQPTIRPDWAGILSYLSDKEKSEILTALFKYPSDISEKCESAFWKETIKPDLDLQYETFKQSCEAKSRGIRNRWGKISITDVKDMNKISIRHDIVTEREREREEESKSEKLIPENINNNTTRAKKKQFTPPTLEEVIAYCATRDLGESIAKKIFDYYSSSDWHDSTGKKIQNWKAKIIAVWDKPENHVKDPDDEPFYL